MSWRYNGFTHWVFSGPLWRVKLWLVLWVGGCAILVPPYVWWATR